jgi:hypothetical protein
MVAFVMAAFCCACDDSFSMADVITGCLWNLRSGFGAEPLDSPVR